MDKFRKKFLGQTNPNGAMKALMPAPMDNNERLRANHREKFAAWLRNEKAKDSMVSSSGPSKLEAKEVLLDLDREAAAVSKYKREKGLDGYATSVPDFVGDGHGHGQGHGHGHGHGDGHGDGNDENVVRDDNIEIPADKFKRGAVYRKGNEFFSDRGEFLYRLPVETMGRR